MEFVTVEPSIIVKKKIVAATRMVRIKKKKQKKEQKLRTQNFRVHHDSGRVSG